MVVYTQGGILYLVRWARKPWVISQAAGEPSVKLVAIRLAGEHVQVAVEAPPAPIVWADPSQYLTEAEATIWAKRGFARPAGRDGLRLLRS